MFELVLINLLGDPRKISKQSMITMQLGECLRNTIGIVFFRLSLSGHIIKGVLYTKLKDGSANRRTIYFNPITKILSTKIESKSH